MSAMWMSDGRMQAGSISRPDRVTMYFMVRWQKGETAEQLTAASPRKESPSLYTQDTQILLKAVRPMPRSKCA